jgi:DNA-directed RNA polymerase specialized sigma24 family protein
MKYEPTNPIGGQASEIEWLMMPFADPPPEANWELIELVGDVIATLDPADQDALHGIFYERKTYQELAEDLNIKAKSHAWRRTASAMDNLKKALLENEKFIEIAGNIYE